MAETKTIVNQQTTRIITKAADVVVVQGQKGETGAQGQAGSDGVGIVSLYALNGFVYASLSDGRDIKIAELPRGPQGPTGPQGVAGTNGVNGVDGVGISAASVVSGSLYLELTDATVLNVGAVIGPQGPQGPTGAKGDQGLQGATGLQGPAGATGAQGPAGSQGPAGVSVSSANIDAKNHLILTLSDATTVDAGVLPAGTGGGSDWLLDAPVGSLQLLPALPANGKWLARNGVQQPSTSYPELAGKTGYPLISIPDSYANVSTFTVPDSITAVMSEFAQTITDSAGNMYINSANLFMYSTDAGATWQNPAFVAENRIAWHLMEHAGKLYASSYYNGDVHIYSASTQAFIQTITISSSYSHFSMVYDSRAGLFYAVGAKVVSVGQSRRYGVFESADGVTWTFKFEAIPQGATEGTLRPRLLLTYSGFVIVCTLYARNLLHTVHFYPDMDSALVEHAVPTNGSVTHDYFFAGGKASGDLVLLLSQSRNYKSTDGGLTFSEFFPTGFGSNGSDIASIGDGGWVVAAGADGILYSKNDGASWATYAASLITSPNMNRLALDSNDNVFGFSRNTTADTNAKFAAFKPAEADFRVPALTPPDSSASWFVKAKP